MTELIRRTKTLRKKLQEGRYPDRFVCTRETMGTLKRILRVRKRGPQREWREHFDAPLYVLKTRKLCDQYAYVCRMQRLKIVYFELDSDD